MGLSVYLYIHKTNKIGSKERGIGFEYEFDWDRFLIIAQLLYSLGYKDKYVYIYYVYYLDTFKCWDLSLFIIFTRTEGQVKEYRKESFKI